MSTDITHIFVCCWFKHVYQLTPTRVVFKLPHPKVSEVTSRNYLSAVDFNMYADLYHPGMSLNCPILKYANLHHPPICLLFAVCCWFKHVCRLTSPRDVFTVPHPKVCQLTSPRDVFELPHPKVCQLTSPTFLCAVDLKIYANLHHPGMSLHYPILKYANLHHPPICVLLIQTFMPTYITQGCQYIAQS